MAGPHTTQWEELRHLVERTLAEFGPAVFWDTRTDLELVPQARVVIDQLSKHGGVRGLRRADEIADRLRSIGELPWR